MARCLGCGRRWEGAHPGCPPAPLAESRPPDPTPDIPGYRIEAVLGTGGNGSVFCGVRARDGLPVAVKVARAGQAEAGVRLLAEARALEVIGPPIVPAVYEFGQLADGAPVVVMEFVKAPTLGDLMAKVPGAMPTAELRECARAVLDAIGVVHARGYVHRDLKPENIFLVVEVPRRAVLVDLGIARGPTSLQSLTVTGEVVGTAEYMAPEQVESIDVDARADVYAFGVILYELLTGRTPFFGSSAVVMQAQRSRRPPRPSELAPVGRAVEEVVLRCLAKEPARRYESVAAVREALEAAWAREDEASGTAVGKVEAAAPAPISAPIVDRAPWALVFFESDEDARALQTLAGSFGGLLAYARGRQYVLTFAPEAGRNPVVSAVRAAGDLLERRATARVLVDLAPVSAKVRPDGTRRVLSPLFTKAEQYPGDREPPGVQLTTGAARAAPDVPAGPLPGGRRLVGASEAEGPQTMLADDVPLIGRDAVLGSLVDAARAACEGGRPTIATVLGDAGTGKSRVSAALANALREHVAEKVIQLRAREPLGGDVDATLRLLLRACLGSSPQGASAPADGGHGLLADKLGRELAEEVWPAVALSLGWIAPDAPEVESLRTVPGALRSLAVRAAGGALRSLAAAAPLCLVLDDAQYADETTLDALEHATLAEAGAAVYIAVFARSSFEKMRPSWGERAAASQPVRLGPLDEASAEALCRQLLLPAEHVPAEALTRLVGRAQGSPLLLVELVRGLKRDGLVRKGAKGGSYYLATDELHRLPEMPGIEWLAEREIGALEADLASHARLCALLGSEFTALEIEGVIQEADAEGLGAMFPIDPGVATRRLLSQGLLVAHRGERLSFRHALIREPAVAALPAQVRERLHGAAFRYYGRAGLADAERLPRLALHAAASGRRGEARDL